MTPTLNEAFDPRANSIGFLRWLLAFAVIFSHAGPLGGFYNGHDLGYQFEQSVGGVAVAGFFFVSGFLITRSRQGKSTIFRFFWRRFLRIFPAFWVVLVITAFLFGPVAWWREKGTFAGYFSVRVEGPLTYVPKNMFLALHQRNIAGLGADIPFTRVGDPDWNGSAWTLIYEFKGYILIGILGLFGFLVHRFLGILVASAILLLNFMLWAGLEYFRLTPFLDNFYNIMFLAPFAFGMLFALLGDKIKIDDRVALACAMAAVFAYTTGGWNIWGQFAFCYVIMWCAIRLPGPMRRWEKHGDLSYGIYIFAWPVMQLSAYFGLYTYGWFVYHLTIVVVVHILAYLSWHLIEKPAMSLKNWTPKPLTDLFTKLRPMNNRIKRLIVSPGFSSTRFAKVLVAETSRSESAGAVNGTLGKNCSTALPPDGPLVTELPSERLAQP